MARALATNRSMVIGIYVPVPVSLAQGNHPIIGSSFASEILAYTEQFYRQHGYDLLVINLSDSQQTLRRCAQKFHSRQVDGILLIRIPQADELCYLGEQNVPAVAIDYAGPEVPVSYISLDNRSAIEAGVDHLVELGHRRIAFLGSCNPETLPDYDARHEAFLSRMAHHGLPVKYDLHWPNTIRVNRELDFQLREGNWAIDFLAQRDDRPTGLITVGDGQAFAAARHLGELGLRCPDDMSIVGFDDSFLARLSKPALTSISHNTRQVTNRACEILLDHIEHWQADRTWPVVQERVRGGLTFRASTAPPGKH